MEENGIRPWLGPLTLPRLRATVRTPTYRRIWALSAVAYVVVSLFIGQMLILLPPGSGTASTPTTVEWLGYGQVGPANNPYFVPALLVVSPHVVLALPFWGTVVMALLGLGIGLSVASTVSVFVSQRRRQAELAASGAAPAVTGWAFLGACCCTSCTAQVAATGVVGAAVGATPSELLTLAWPLAVLQLGVVALSLLYLEHRLSAPPSPPAVPPSGRRLAGAITVRVLLLVAAVTWLFSLVVEGAAGAPLSPALLYHWVVEHGLLAGAALASALVPMGLGRLFASRSRVIVLLRGALFVGGVTWGIGLPPPFVVEGLGGTVNEILGFLGVSAASGGVSPDAGLGAALLFHWGFQHLLLAGWAIALAFAPLRLLEAVGAGEPGSSPLSHPRSAPVPAPLLEAKGEP